MGLGHDMSAEVADITELSAVQLRLAIADRELSCVEVVQAFCAKIEELNPKYHCFSFLNLDQGIERAKHLDLAIADGQIDPKDIDRYPLLGLPTGDKDLINRAEWPTSSGSRFADGFVASVDHPLVQVLDSCGAVSLGKTAVPEFGLSCYCENQLTQPSEWAQNPAAPGCTPGGSSGGAAGAVAAKMLPFAVGSDGGGSIRIPAAACSVVGLKPSRGRVPSGSGMDSLAGLVVCGPLANTAQDCALVMDALVKPRVDLVGSGTGFSLQAPQNCDSYLASLARQLPSLKIGWNTWSPWGEEYQVELDPIMEAELAKQLGRLTDLGHQVIRAAAPKLDGYAEAFKAVWQANAACLPVSGSDLELVEPLTRWLIEQGRALSAAALAGYLKQLSAMETAIIEAYADFDVVVTPALAQPPAPLGWFTSVENQEENFARQCRYTPYVSYLNVSGLPGLVLPVARQPYPIGVQLIGRPGCEQVLLALANQLMSGDGLVC